MCNSEHNEKHPADLMSEISEVFGNDEIQSREIGENNEKEKISDHSYRDNSFWDGISLRSFCRLGVGDCCNS